jgi:Ras-related protein Rab-2A
MDQDILFRVIIVGDTGVGKSCLLLRFSENTFNEQHNVTIGVEFGSKSIEIGTSSVKLQIWDTAGQESFRSITRSFYRRADGVLLVYDATARHTFDNCKYWLEEIRQNSASDVVVYLVANQIDLVATEGENREVSTQEGQDFAKQNNLSGFKETSARSGINVNEAFNDFCSILFNRWKEHRDVQLVEKPKIDLRPVVKTKKPRRRCYICFLSLNIHIVFNYINEFYVIYRREFMLV